MAQLLLVKDQLVTHEFDDIVGFFEDDHKFSDHEKLVFNILRIEGYTRQQIVDLVSFKQPERKRIYKLSVANKWTLMRPERKIAWKHTDNKWYFLEEEPQLMWTLKNMTQSEKDTLSSKNATQLEKSQALNHLECKIPMNAKNMIEATDLN